MAFEKLFVNIFEKKPGDNDSKPILQELVKKYPYFSLPQFFLLQQSAVGEHGYEKMAARTALHFDNPFLLNYRLTQVETNVVETTGSDIAVEEPAIVRKKYLSMKL